jgi:serine/threonine-protein kinase
VRSVGRFQVEEEIARGGMGVVFRGLDPANGQAVAIKVLLGGAFANEVTQKRFAREAEALGRVEHAGVVRLLEHDVTQRGEPYTVMELVKGRSLQDRLDHTGPLPPAEAVDCLLQLCEAVAACHAAGVLHRDLKPDNVLVTAEGSLTLTDFGLVRDTDPSLSRTQLTGEGQLQGTPGFWAPEQAGGELGQIGERTDVYGLGATLFALLTGRPPHQGDTLLDVLQGMSQAPPVPSTLAPDVPAWLDQAVARALARDPADRHADAQELAEALAAGSFADRTSAAPALAAAALVILAGAAAAGIVLSRSTPAPDRPPAAEGAVSAEARAAYDRGRRLSDEGRYAEARDAFSEAIRLQADFAAAWHNRGAVRGQLGDDLGQIADATEAIRLAPQRAGYYNNRGLAYRAVKEFGRALQDYERSLELDPELGPAWENLRKALEAIGPDGQGDGLADSYLRRAPAARLALREGLTLATADDSASAKDVYSEAIHLDPSFACAYFLRGNAQEELGDFRGAVEDYTATLRLVPRSAQAHNNRGVARGHLQDWQGEIDDCSEAIRLDPGLAWAYANRAYAKAELDDHQGAIEDFTTSIGLDPTYAYAYVNRGMAHGNLGQLEAAKADFERALELDPEGESAAPARAALEKTRGLLAERRGQ